MENPFAKKLPKGAESCLILACTASFAPYPMMVFVRLHRPQILQSHCEVKCPTRFVCIIIGPPSSERRVVDMGKAMGTLMSDQVWQPLVKWILDSIFFMLCSMNCKYDWKLCKKTNFWYFEVNLTS